MISVVIPSYNRRSCIFNLLRDIFAQSATDFEVIVVDDCSSDGSAAMVSRDFPRATLLVNEKNGGPCVTRNRGIRAARGEIIVGFDSDVSVPDRHLLSKVACAFAESPQASGFAFRIFDRYQQGDDAPRWWHPVALAAGSERTFETNYFSGTAYAFRRDAMFRGGLFPEIFYMHYEEVELALRILDDCGSIFYRPDLAAVHHANPVSRRSEIKVFYKPRNQVLLAMRCYPWPRALAYLTPRIGKGLLDGVRNRSMREWWRAMQSAADLGAQCLEERKGIATTTWKRIAAMRNQNLQALLVAPKVVSPTRCRMSVQHRHRVLLIAPYMDRNEPGESWSTYQWVAGISASCETTVLTCHKPGWNPDHSPTGAARLIDWPEPRIPGMRGRLAWELKPGYGFFYFQARRWIKEALRRGERFDLVHQINPLALRYPSPAHDLGLRWIIGPLAGSLPTPEGFAEASREKVWFRKLRGLDQFRLRHDPWLRGTYAKAAAVIGVAPYVGELLAPCKPARFEIMAETGVEAVAEVAKVAPAPGSPLRLLFVGRIIRTKGILDAIRAIAMVGRRGLVRLDVVGDGDLLETCRDQVTKLGLGSQVTFHGRLSRSEVFDWYGRSHVFLFPSFREPSGNVVFEAMSQGLPVIACENGGPGYVVDSSCGLKVAPSDPDEFAHQLAERIVTLASQPDLFASLSAGALKRMRSMALWPAKIELMLDLYDDLITPKITVPASETLLKGACENE